MESSERDQATQHHQPHISSLVVRPSVSDGGDSGRVEGGRVGGAGDYEPGEVRRDPPPYYRSDRYKDDSGYRIRAGSSSSPARRIDGDHRHISSDFDHSDGPSRASRREPSGRYRNSSSLYARGRVGGRPFGRGLGVGLHGPLRGDGMGRNNNPNVRPREGDWFCPDPLCRNLNFARREYCNNCKRYRYAPPGSPPRRGYPAHPPPLPPPRRFPGPPMTLSPGRNINAYRSLPRGWARDAPRDFAPGSSLPPPRHDPIWRERERDRIDYPNDDYQGSRLDRTVPMEWGGHADRGRDGLLSDRKGYYERQPPPLSPPPPQLPLPQCGSRRGRDGRERSRSPQLQTGGPLVKDNHRDGFAERGRNDRRGGGGGGFGRDRIRDAY